MHQKFSLGIAIGISIVVIVSWIFLIAPDLKNNPQYFETNIETKQDAAFAKNVGDPLPDDTTLYLSTVKREIVEDNGKILKMNTIIRYENYQTGEIIRNSEEVLDVDKGTRKYVDVDDVYFILPMNIQKQNYNYLSYGNNFLVINYDRIDEINGLETFVYKSDGTYDLSGTFSHYPSDTIMQDMQVEFWVEPISGQVLGFENYWTLNAIKDNQEILIATGHGKTTDYSFTILSEWARQKIELFYLYDTIIPILLVAISAGLVFVVFVNQNLRNRTEELKQEKKEKFETLGKLAVNLAHDIKNPLASMKQSLEIIQRKTKDDEITGKESERANRVIKRIEHQVDRVLNYVKTPPLLTKNTTVLTILKQSLDIITIPDNITIEIPEKDFEVKWDEAQISVVFTNIILNAIQAIGKNKGKISIRVAQENDSIKIEIENSGPNIPEKDLDKIFEPLFTTKMEGTGLGLAGCKNIIESHKGTITVSNNPVKFTIKIPKFH